MTSYKETFAYGAAFGAFIMAIFTLLVASLPNSFYSMTKNALVECEKNIPRNQHCVITAVPYNKESSK